MRAVRIGIVGVGNMGTIHARTLAAGKIERAVLAAVCDYRPDRLAGFGDVPSFHDCDELLRSGVVDAVLIATPHFAHTTLGQAALRAGLHVLVEKPVSVHKRDCERLLAAHVNPHQVFAAMFNQRTDPFYRQFRNLIRTDALGKIRRVQWTVTNWFRTEAYYASGGWRATWAGEGGGVLLNQCPHNLDLYQWLFGMPQRIRGHCRLGRYHAIEVEDDVTAYFEHADGATATFIASTGEAPGTNRLEICAERGRLVYENDRLTFIRNEVPMSEFSRSTKELFASPATTTEEFSPTGHGGQHAEILKNFVDAILDGAPLIAPAAEGIHSVELANAILFSSQLGQTLTLPLDSSAYERFLQDKIANSRFKKNVTDYAATAGDFAQSFR